MQPDVIRALLTVKPARVVRRKKRTINVYRSSGASVKTADVIVPSHIDMSRCPICGESASYEVTAGFMSYRMGYKCEFKITYKSSFVPHDGEIDDIKLVIADSSSIGKCVNHVAALAEYEEHHLESDDII